MRKALALCVVFVGLLPARAAAEWHFTPFVGLTFKGATNTFDVEQAAGETHTHFGGAISLLGAGIVGVEGVGVWTPGFFQSDDALIDNVEKSRVIAVMGNVVLTTPRRLSEYNLRPYFSGGGGLMHSTVTQIDSLPGGPPVEPARVNAAGFNLGVGAIGFFSERTGVRFDFRYYSTFRRSDDLISVPPEAAYLRYMTASVGIVWRRR